ncbi:MAG: DUF6580 family putative transport protein [Bacteroidota bacterium]|nr:DUF6580 family putative transport protein [Bacteroidota bacterium]
MNKKIVAPIFIFILLSVVRLTSWEGYAPMLAITFFAGAIGMSWRGSVLVPLAALLMGDVLMALNMGDSYYQYFINGEYIGIYMMYLVSAYIGFLIKERVALKNIVVGSVTAILLFFIVSNFMVWAAGLDMNSKPYTKDMTGLVLCYTNALPFLLKSFIGNGIATIILFGSYAWVSKKYLVKA